ncbi:MAG: hypothetical protein AAFV72_05015 [Cyanobacteria bacterium J06635_1]
MAKGTKLYPLEKSYVFSLEIFVKPSGAQVFEHDVLQHDAGNLPSPRFFVIQGR